MDLCGAMLQKHLPNRLGESFQLETPLPAFRRLFSRLPLLGRKSAAFNADRLFNRFGIYPRQVRRIATRFDLFHVVDQTYSQLIHELPSERTGVYCHDLDFARSILDPKAEPRPRWYRAISKRILSGFQKARFVFHSTLAVRDQILARGLIEPEKLIHAPYGVLSDLGNAEENKGAIPSWMAALAGKPYLLHVGSCIPRKRIDVLLSIFEFLKGSSPDCRLLKVGSNWTPKQRQQIQEASLNSKIVEANQLSAWELGLAYRNAKALLMTSEAEGFGLPVIEALSCGTPVIASDIPALREAGGPAALYCPVGDIGAWVETIQKITSDNPIGPNKESRCAWAAQFTWEAHANTIANAYLNMLSN